MRKVTHGSTSSGCIFLTLNKFFYGVSVIAHARAAAAVLPLCKTRQSSAAVGSVLNLTIACPEKITSIF